MNSRKKEGKPSCACAKVDLYGEYEKELFRENALEKAQKQAADKNK